VKFIDEFRNKDIAQGLIRKIFEVSTRPVHLMEVCGTGFARCFRNTSASCPAPAARCV
jgi:hydrogenase maturation factor